jgi:hypothetical protein
LGSEDSLLRTIVSLGDDYRSLLNHIRVDFLSSSGLHDFLKIISFHEICETQWLTIVSRLEGLRDDLIEKRRFVSLFESRILSDFSTFPSILSDLKNTGFELLYRGSRDGFGMSEFHRRCDGRSRTLVLIKTKKGNIFGGYTPLELDSTSGSKKDESLQTFLFTLKNPRGLDPIRFDLKSGGVNAIYCTSSYFAFGGGHDIYVYDNCDKTKNNYTNFGYSFENSTRIDPKIVFDGEHNFTVEELEVLTGTERRGAQNRLF